MDDLTWIKRIAIQLKLGMSNFLSIYEADSTADSDGSPLMVHILHKYIQDRNKESNLNAQVWKASVRLKRIPILIHNISITRSGDSQTSNVEAYRHGLKREFIKILPERTDLQECGQLKSKFNFRSSYSQIHQIRNILTSDSNEEHHT